MTELKQKSRQRELMSEEKNRKEKKFEREREDGGYSAMMVRLMERADVGDARNPDTEIENLPEKNRRRKEKRERIEGKIVGTLCL